jgi:hypothetical protein
MAPSDSDSEGGDRLLLLASLTAGGLLDAFIVEALPALGIPQARDNFFPFGIVATGGAMALAAWLVDRWIVRRRLRRDG